MIRPILLFVALLPGGPALACALPPPDQASATASPCAAIRLVEGLACVDDPVAPGGYRIVSDMDPSLPDCGDCTPASVLPSRKGA